LALHQTTDLKSKKTRKDIVDGQQRSQAIYDFLDDKLRLSGKTEFGRCTYSQLQPEQQQKFLDYSLTVDLFVGATPEDIRQVFRRMNSYTVPLNPQEKRHATHQGELKWFIVEMTERYADTLKQLGVFREKQLSRMADAALLSDVFFTFQAVIKSASEVSIDRFYTENETAFPNSRECADRLIQAMNWIVEWKEIRESALMKSYNFYTLLLAVTHAQNPLATLNSDFNRQSPIHLDNSYALPNLTTLSAALDEPSAFPSLSPYVSACSKSTNRIEQRRTRFVWLSRALENTLLV
jgi:hypothetical protein